MCSCSPLNEAVLTINSQVPVLYEVRDVTLAKNGTDALVSYENKVRKIFAFLCSNQFF